MKKSLTTVVDFPDLFHPDLINKSIRVKLYNLKQKICLGTIMRIGHNEEYAYVSEPSEGEIEVPRHHICMQKPARCGNKVVVARGNLLGKLGTVESKSLKYKGKWLVKEHSMSETFLVDPKDLAVVEKFPTLH